MKYRFCGGLFVLLCAVVAMSSIPDLANAVNPPPYAASVGYNTNTFSTNFTTATTDTTGSYKTGFSWYPYNFFGSKTRTSAIAVNSDGTVTLKGDTTGPNGEIVTAGALPGNKFVGTAFGGGAYVEAIFKFNPADVLIMRSQGWPSFWALPVESSATQNNQWIGAPKGYAHSVETDFFEYLYLPYASPFNAYGTSIHDWYGIPNVTCKGLCAVNMPSAFNKKLAPEGTDFNQYHRFGFLWVPATAKTTGYARFYLDGKAMGGDYNWTQFTGQLPTPQSKSWAFGGLDKQHMVLILGTGPGEPMTIQSVNVWQASAAQNLHY